MADAPGPGVGQPVDLPGIQPVLLPRVSDEVAEQIRRLIVSEQLAEGAGCLPSGSWPTGSK